MGRKQINFIHHYFNYDENTGTSKCIMKSCGKDLQGKHAANLLRHFLARHRSEFEFIMKKNQEYKLTKSTDTTRSSDCLTDITDQDTIKLEVSSASAQLADDDDEEGDDPLQSSENDSARDIVSPLQKRDKLVSLTEFVRASSSHNIPNQKRKTMLNEASCSHENKHDIRDDQFDLFGKNVAAKLRDIALKDNTQRLIAEKIVNDALFYAEIGQLTLAHCTKLNPE